MTCRLLLVLVLTQTLLAAEATTSVLLDSRATIDGAHFQANQSAVSLVESTDGSHAIQVIAKAGQSWPGITIRAPEGRWDLSRFSHLSVDLRNVDDHDIDIYVRVDNPGANGRDHCMTERIGTQPDQRVTITLPLKRQASRDFGLFAMKGYPQGLYAEGGIDPANVVAFTIFNDNQPAQDNRFEIVGIRAFGTYRRPPWMDMAKEDFFPCIDRFGQFIHSEWPGKIRSEDDLAAARAAEDADLAAHPAPPGWNRWGGWADGPRLDATGAFRTAKHDGRWWLVDPDGHLFFSVGVTCVDFGGAQTPIDGRETWFADLPTDPADPLSAFRASHGKSWGGGYYAGKSPVQFNFTAANLFRKYGEGWRETATARVHDRLRSWGLNTIGNWSDGRICSQKRTPYTCTFFYDSPRLRDGAVHFPDVFAPTFAAALDRGIRQFAGHTAEDPWCIGYFVDNEMPWGGDDTLARYALASPATQAAKTALADWLRHRHGEDIAGLNAAWGMTWSDWAAFAADTKAKPAGPKAQRDLADFTALMAETYFGEVKAAIRRFSSQRLYLGCRSVGGALSAVAASVRHCDVVSYNRYCASVRDIRLPGGLDAPVLIGEFHFGGLDRGPFWGGLFSADDQADRAAKLTAYLESALDNPQMVGAHWFQYGDQAATGRIDGENAQCGWVDVCDTPYAETVAAGRAVAAAMYRRRAGAP